MLYVDTSVIVKLYIKEEKSLEASNLIIKNNEAIPLTSLHELEFTNAINLKQFRAEITTDDARLIISRFNDHESKGIFFRPLFNWADTFKYAIDLSNNHTQIMGSRSPDILHVALALSIKANRFLSFNDRQSKLASLSGLKIEWV